MNACVIIFGRKTKGNVPRHFTHFCKFLKGDFCRGSPISTARNDRLNLGKFLNLIEHISSVLVQFFILKFHNMQNSNDKNI